METKWDGSPTREIVEALKAAHPAEIEAASADLHHSALMKLVDGVSRRRQRASDPQQGELFRRFSLPKAIVMPGATGTKRDRDRLPIRNVTIAQAMAYSQSKPPERRPVRDQGLADFLEAARPFITSPDQTVGEALAALEAAEARAAAAG
ncbi:hypothetical protein NS228_06235 [Methylobacterium indicum]|nr:hypothetical protein NS229_14595 [Methylobacterium indicum]KTS41557.1 hypothetical protein NS228_06235 [Methylobacterium indicum]KTS45172.1 hypothetical protein NS230_24225 [Methylobacterium indicum]